MSSMNDEMFLRARNREYEGLKKGKPVESYTFVQLADPQFGLLGATMEAQWLRNLRCLVEVGSLGFANGKEVVPVPLIDQIHNGQDSDKLFEIELSLAKKSVNIINELLPTFAVVCGDLVHAYPAKDPKKNAEQVKAFKEVYSQVDDRVALVCSCGNHDVGDRPTRETISLWKTRFGDDYFSFWVGKDQYIVLNSQLYKDSTAFEEGFLEQEIWLDDILKESDARHKVVMSHIPPFINSADEPSGYFPLSKEIRLKLLNKLSSAGVSHWFCGHYHRNAGGVFVDEKSNELEVITTGAVGANIKTDPEGDELSLSGMLSLGASSDRSMLRIVSVGPQGISHELKYFKEYE